MKKNLVFFILLLMAISANAQLKVSSNGDVGIGTTSPAEKLHINGSVRGNQLHGSLRINTDYKYVDIGCNHYYGDHTHFITNTNYGFYFNKGVEVVGGSFSSFTGDLTLATQRNKYVWVKTSGYVGIGDDTPSYKLDVNGDIATYGVLRISSDQRLKKDIVDLDAGKINNLYNLQAKTYIKDNSLLDIENEITSTIGDTIVREDIKNEIDTTPKIGFIAQELQEYFPNLVKQDNKGFYNIDYISLIPVLVEAVKDHRERIIDLEDKLEELKSSNSNLKSESISLNSTDPPIDNSEMQSYLSQNRPNPFNQDTEIDFYISSKYSNAELYIYDMQGTQIKSYDIQERGHSYVTIHGSEFNPGMYLYTLIVDGNEIDTKRMILTN